MSNMFTDLIENASRRASGHVTWVDLARAAMPGCPEGLVDHMLWNCSAYPFAGPRETYYQLRHSWRLTERSGHIPCAPDGGFR